MKKVGFLRKVLSAGAAVAVSASVFPVMAHAAEGDAKIGVANSAIPKSKQMDSDLPAGSCNFRSNVDKGKSSGFRYHTFDPVVTSPSKTKYGFFADFDGSKDRTIRSWSFSSSGLIANITSLRNIQAVQPGYSAPGSGFKALETTDEEAVIDFSRRQRNLNLFSNLTPEKIKKYAERKASDNPDEYLYGWVDDYDNDNVYGLKFFVGNTNFEAGVSVNPWPSENDNCSPIKARWESIEKHVIIPGEETLVGKIDADENSMPRMVVEAYDEKGEYIGGSNDGVIRIDQSTGEFFLKWPKFRETKLSGVKGIRFAISAIPRTVDQLNAAIPEDEKENSVVAEESNIIKRYNTPNIVDTHVISLDDTIYHNPEYNKYEQEIISGVTDGKPATEPQKVVFTQVGEKISELVKKREESGFEALVDLDEKFVFDGWTAEIEPGTYNLVVTAPEDAKPGTFAQPRVIVTYSNGSKDIIPVLVVITPNNTQVTDLVSPEISRGTPNTTMTAKFETKPIYKNKEKVEPKTYTIDPASIPEGWEVTINDAGEITATPNEDIEYGMEAIVKVTATYPDGTTDEGEATFLVTNSIKIPDYGAKHGKIGDAITLTPKLPDIGTSGRSSDAPPAKYTFTNDQNEITVAGWLFKIDENTGEVTTTIPKTAVIDSTIAVPVKAHYEDVNPQIIEGHITTVGENESTLETINMLAGDSKTVNVTEGIDLPDGSTVEIKNKDNIPAGWSYNIDEKGNLTVSPDANMAPGENVTLTTVINTPNGVSFEVNKVFVVAPEPVRRPIPFKVEYQYDPSIEQGKYEVKTKGEPGSEIQSISNKTDWIVEKEPVNEVVLVGTKPAKASDTYTWTTPTGFNTEWRPNKELKPGEVKVVQQGVSGEKTVTVTFSATVKPGEEPVVESQKEEVTKEPVTQILEYGPGIQDQVLTFENRSVVPFKTIVTVDNDLPAGTQVVDTEGKNGEDLTITTQKLVDGMPDGDPVSKTTRVTEPVNAVIRVGGKTEGEVVNTFDTEKPFDVEFKFDPSIPAGETKVEREGVPGKKTVTITQKIVNSKPAGDPVVDEKVINEPVNKVILVGMKQDPSSDKVTWVEPIPFGTIVRPGKDLKPGEVRVVQEGKDGSVTYTATFTDDNGETAVTTDSDRVKPVDRIIEYGEPAGDTVWTTTTERPVPFETKIVVDPNLPAGTTVVDKEGVLGKDVVTVTQKVVDGEPVGDPSETVERVTDPVDAVIRVGGKCDCSPSPEPSEEPSPDPSEDPTPEPSGDPSEEPSENPSEEPSDPDRPSPKPPVSPTDPADDDSDDKTPAPSEMPKVSENSRKPSEISESKKPNDKGVVGNVIDNVKRMHKEKALKKTKLPHSGV